MSRNRLVEYLAKANDAFDNMLIKLSVGALGLSFAFYRLVVVDSEPLAPVPPVNIDSVFPLTPSS